jgi:predicted dehydrogenase
MKVLVAGLGSIGQRHVRNLRTLMQDDVEILAYRQRGLAHVIDERMRIVEGRSVEEFYNLKRFVHLGEALAQRPDAVLVCNPSSQHLLTARAALDAGCHVLIEKPLSSSYAGVDELIELAERTGRVAAVGYQMRFHPGLLRLRSLLQDKAIGTVLAVRAEMAEYLPDAHPYEDYRDSYAAQARLGGGAILCFIHEFDYVQWLFGLPRRVFTTGGRLGDLEIDVEDTAVSSLECGVEGRPIAAQVYQSFAQGRRSRTCLVTGTHGRLHLDLNVPVLTRIDRDGGVHEERFPDFERNQMFLDEMRQFLAAVSGGGPPAVAVREAAGSLRMALAAQQSLRTGAAVAIR